MGKPTPESRPSILVVELWGVGDLALAMPFIRAAADRGNVTLLAKPHAAPLLRRFAPSVTLVPLEAPWTRFEGKYRLLQWPWKTLAHTRAALRSQKPDIGVSARPDPRDHLLLSLSGARRRIGYPRAGSGLFLTETPPMKGRRHRAEQWDGLAEALGWPLSPLSVPRVGPIRRVAIHPGAARAVRRWPRERFEEISRRMKARGITVEWLDEAGDLERLLDRLSAVDAFVGNDSGPGHLAAVLGVPTFTLFGPQLPESFAPRHPRSAWIEGAPCPYKPCFDACRFAEPRCLLANSAEDAWHRIEKWLAGIQQLR